MATVFFIGRNAVSLPNPCDWPPVDMVVMKPVVCCDVSRFDLHSQQAGEISAETLQTSGLSEQDVRGIIADVSEAITRRASCCWKLGWTGPLFPVIVWLDMIFSQCSCGIARSCCHAPAMEEVNSVLNRHNAALQSKGCTLSIVNQDVDMANPLQWTPMGMNFDCWLIKAVCTRR
jgi:hypothetical protein